MSNAEVVLRKVLDAWVKAVGDGMHDVPGNMSLAAAKEKSVCRFCGKGQTDGPGCPFELHFGKEHCHAACALEAWSAWKSAGKKAPTFKDMLPAVIYERVRDEIDALNTALHRLPMRENEEKVGDAFRALIASIENDAVLKKAELEGLGSMLLSVQKDCIRAKKESKVWEDSYECAKRDIKAEFDGNQELRRKAGAKDHESFHVFVERLVIQRDSWQEDAQRYACNSSHWKAWAGALMKAIQDHDSGGARFSFGQVKQVVERALKAGVEPCPEPAEMARQVPADEGKRAGRPTPGVLESAEAEARDASRACFDVLIKVYRMPPREGAWERTIGKYDAFIDLVKAEVLGLREDNADVRRLANALVAKLGTMDDPATPRFEKELMALDLYLADEELEGWRRLADEGLRKVEESEQGGEEGGP